MIRNFKLINAKGDVLDLMQSSHFAHNPSGLGINFNNDYAQSKTDFILNKTELNQGELNLTVAFGINTKQAYKDFASIGEFLNYQPMTLAYYTNGTDEYLRDCRLASLSKSELQTGRILDEELILEFISPWYRWEDGKLPPYADQFGDGKVYSYTYDYVYEDDISAQRDYFLINNQSMYFGIKETSPLEITIEADRAEITNPSWTVHVGTSVVQSDGYFLTIPIGSKLIVSSNPHDHKAKLVSFNGEETNVYQLQDMTKSNFVTAPIGESILSFVNVSGAIVSYRLKKEVMLV
ncbi:TPA: phage baseplate protein [Streptococcus suis]|nr:phage baseplate protein [Streptococcus suis]